MQELEIPRPDQNSIGYNSHLLLNMACPVRAGDSEYRGPTFVLC